MLDLGIHFNLAAQRYHDDPGLGSTKLKKIALDATEFQYENLHGEEKDTLALLWGKAIHCRTLEGKIAFGQQFICAPAQEDYAGRQLLVTSEHLKEHCSKLGTRPGKDKASAIAAIREWDPSVLIWDEIVDKFNKGLDGSKTVLTRAVLKQIEQAAQWMQADHLLAPLMEDGTFIHGSGEVSIFYEEDGVRLKARLDRLLPHAIVDLKSFRPTLRENIKNSVIRAIGRERYDLQAASYIRALKAARELAAAGRVFGATEHDAAILAAVLKSESMKWIWVFVKAAGAPQPLVRELDLASLLFSASSGEIANAINTYRTMMSEYGSDADWTPQNNAEVLGDGDFPPWAFR